MTTYFIYNERHQLIGEYDSSGNAVAEHIYFGQRPVALSKNNQLFAVHTDYLGTPRIITDTANTVQWKWLNTNLLGSNLPTVENITYNLRFAGQYFDSESKLHYNYYRTYNPSTSRYMQSDPIGLAGGANTYNYVGFNPLNGTDPLGLSKEDGAKIMKLFNQHVNTMTERGIRLPGSGEHNNNNWLAKKCNPSIGAFVYNPNGCSEEDTKKEVCEGQSFSLMNVLSSYNGNKKKNPEAFDDYWVFNYQSGIGHFWVVAVSSNPNDQSIWMDPWKEQISVGQRCLGCHGMLKKYGSKELDNYFITPIPNRPNLGEIK